jgi:hypothetical protein
MANPITAATDSVKNAVKGNFNLKTIFTLGAVGTVATAGGMLLAPFFAASAGGAAVAAGATNGSVLGSFWAPLFTSTTGEVGLTAGISKMFAGVGALAKSGWAVVSAAWDPTQTVSQALSSPFALAR